MGDTSSQIPETKLTSDLDKSTNQSPDQPIETKKPPKPPKPEDKPFEQFITEELIPNLSESLNKKGVKPRIIKLIEGERPIVGGICWMVYCELNSDRRFWLTFNEKKITSIKNIAIAERGTNPSLLESFLIDEKKTTLALIVSRILQRLNGQKWLEPN